MDKKKSQDIYNEILIKMKEEFYKTYNKKKFTRVVSIKDFTIIKTIGTGAFGRVIFVKEKNTEDALAIKILKKKFIIQTKQLDHILTEKLILEAINFPFFVNAKYCFKDNTYVYFVMPFVNGGELFTYLRRYNKFDEELSKFYAAQVLLALEYLHYLDFIYRDLKPENILIQASGYIKIIDFGFVKMLTAGRTYTFCGTPEYIAPEVILNKGYGTSADWWSFGILIYEMCAGYPAFYHNDPMKLYDKIINSPVKYPQHFSHDLKDIIKNLLEVDLSRRYGNLKNGANDIKNHRWFGRVNFMDIYNGKMKPPYKPDIKSREDTSNYEEYEEEKLSVGDTDEYADKFANF